MHHAVTRIDNITRGIHMQRGKVVCTIDVFWRTAYLCYLRNSGRRAVSSGSNGSTMRLQRNRRIGGEKLILSNKKKTNENKHENGQNEQNAGKKAQLP